MGCRALLQPSATRLDAGTGRGEIGLAGIPQRHLVEHAEGRSFFRRGSADQEECGPAHRDSGWPPQYPGRHQLTVTEP